jgi:hypothetical protein
MDTPNHDTPVLDFSGYEFKPGLDDGYYICAVTAVTPTVAGSGRAQIRFDLRFPNGSERNEWISIPTGPDDAVMAIWKFAFESAGYTPEEIKGFGPLSVNGIIAKFYERSVHIEYKNGNKDLGKRMKVKLIAPYFYEKGLVAMAATGGGSSGSVSSFGGGKAAKTSSPPPVIDVTTPSSSFGGQSGQAAALTGLMNAGG